jgi:hypothetical protein
MANRRLTMNENTTGSMAREDLLASITEGMEVYDSAGEQIGKVDSVYLGEVEDGQATDGGATTAEAQLSLTPPMDMDDIAGLFLTKSDIPKEVRQRLRYQGFIRIAPHGLFRTHRYAARDQVAAVAGDRVTLSTAESKLIKG